MHLASSPPGQRCLYPSSTTVPDIMYAAMATWNVPFDTPVEWGPSQGAPSSGNVEWGRRMGQHASASNGTSTKCQSGWRSDPIKRGMSKSNHQPRLLQDRSHDPNPLTQEGGGSLLQDRIHDPPPHADCAWQRLMAGLWGLCRGSRP